jgi:hypothetical protein
MIIRFTYAWLSERLTPTRVKSKRNDLHSRGYEHHPHSRFPLCQPLTQSNTNKFCLSPVRLRPHKIPLPPPPLRPPLHGTHNPKRRRRPPLPRLRQRLLRLRRRRIPPHGTQGHRPLLRISLYLRLAGAELRAPSIGKQRRERAQQHQVWDREVHDGGGDRLCAQGCEGAGHVSQGAESAVGAGAGGD